MIDLTWVWIEISFEGIPYSFEKTSNIYSASLVSWVFYENSFEA